MSRSIPMTSCKKIYKSGGSIYEQYRNKIGETNTAMPFYINNAILLINLCCNHPLQLMTQ